MILRSNAKLLEVNEIEIKFSRMGESEEVKELEKMLEMEEMA